MRTILDQESERRTYKNAYQGLDPMFPHLVFLSAMAGTWQDHLEYLRLQLAFYVCLFFYSHLGLALTSVNVGRKGMLLLGRSRI